MKLMVAEDEVNLAHVLQKELRRLGHDVSVAHDGTTGLREMLELEFDVVFLDIMMPGVSGLEICQRVRQKYPDTVVVMVSAMTDIQYAIDALRQGAFDYVTKPFKLMDIEQALHRCSQHRLLRKANRDYENRLKELVASRTTQLSATNADLQDALDKLYGNYQATLKALALALEKRGAEAAWQLETIVAYSMRLGTQFGLTDRDLRALEQGALLHDIGKIGVPDAILSKRGPLTDDEWVQVRRHVDYGTQIISGLNFMEGASLIVAQHHERYDGTGYPRGTAGEQICLGARIFALADAFDAMTSDRPYRPAFSFEDALGEIRRCAGTQFDPAVVQVFSDVPLDEWRNIACEAKSKTLARTAAGYESAYETSPSSFLMTSG
jgi:response regulator RpfG family c-di-GMP phosphodiesterase